MNTALAIILPIVLCIIVNVFVMHPLLIRIFEINMFKDKGLNYVEEPTTPGVILVLTFVLPPLITVVVSISIICRSLSVYKSTGSSISDMLERVGKIYG